jgi:hypothetical protein
VTVLPAIVKVPVRGNEAALLATLYTTVPFPSPLLPDVMESHEALLVAVHEHPPAAVTPALTDPPAADTLTVGGDTLYEQGTENVNVLDGALRLEPPGPTAAIVDV